MENETTLAIKHHARLHRHGTHTTNVIIKLLEESDDRITFKLRKILDGLTPAERRQLLKGHFKTRRLIQLRESIRELVAETKRGLSSSLKEEGLALAAYELTHEEKLIALTVDKAIKVGVTGTQAYAAAMSRPMQGKHVRDLIADLPVKIRKDIFAEIRHGYIEGDTVPQILKRIDRVHKDRDKKIETIVRTSLNHIASVSKMETFKDLDINEYYLSVVFDGRTSKICASWNANGIEYFKVGEGPLPPFHMNCRTIPMARVRKSPAGKKPVVKDKRPVSKIPKDQRKGKIGQVDADMTFNDVLKSDSNFAKEWLGPTRYKLWKEGKYKLDRFVDPRRKPYTIAELRGRDSKTFNRLGL